VSPRPVAGAEIQRILALVPWVVAHPGATTREIAARFDVTEAQIERDLDLVLMIGVPPYSPGDYLDVEVDDEDRVTIRLAEHFRRPLRLTPAEGLALLAAGRALTAVPGTDPEGALATALAKLEAALGSPAVRVEVSEAEHLDAIREAVAQRERVEIDYWSAGRDELLTRRIDPVTVFFALGAWYVGAYCHRAEGERMFRVDRIRGVRRTGERFAPVALGLEPDTVYNPRPEDPRVTLRVTPGAAWVAEAYPTEALTERPGGELDLVLAVSERAWLERLLLRLGPDARVVAPHAWRDAGPAAARRVLARYTGGSGTPATGRPSDGRRDRP
jgi:proteasome accessory factor C